MQKSRAIWEKVCLGRRETVIVPTSWWFISKLPARLLEKIAPPQGKSVPGRRRDNPSHCAPWIANGVAQWLFTFVKFLTSFKFKIYRYLSASSMSRCRGAVTKSYIPNPSMHASSAIQLTGIAARKKWNRQQFAQVLWAKLPARETVGT